jgi:hypothetical protein
MQGRMREKRKQKIKMAGPTRLEGEIEDLQE